MASHWYEVWTEETLELPYILLIVAKNGEEGLVQIYDPREGMQLIYHAPNYQAAKDWLWEDEYTRVDGRMVRE